MHNKTMTTTTESQGLLVQLLDPSNRADPYPFYRQILKRGPLVLPEENLVVFSSLQDCGDVLRHPSSASDRLKSAVTQREIAKGAPARPFGQPGFLFLDPPDHTRLRKLAQQAFAPKRVRALEADIVSMVDSLLDRIATAGRFDVIADLAHPLPVAVICRMLGVPIDDEPEFSRASALLAQGLPGASEGRALAAGIPRRPHRGTARYAARGSDNCSDRGGGGR
jgi:cytochrome P450